MSPKLKHFFCLSFLVIVTLTIHGQVTPTSAAERLKGLEQRKILEQKSLLNEIAFHNIGPSIMSGRVVDLDVNPKDPTEFYVAYATGGLWYTNNNGQSFIPVFDSADVIGIGDVADDDPIGLEMLLVCRERFGCNQVRRHRVAAEGIEAEHVELMASVLVDLLLQL